MATAEAPLAPWNISVSDYPAGGDVAKRLAFLLGYAVLAPSGHNTQPWLFAVAGDAVELYADRASALPVVDPEDRELTMSCGAALLNLRVALRRFGYRYDASDLFPDPGEPDLLARVRPVEGEPPSPEDQELFEAIPRRRTTRAAFEERGVPADVRRELMEDAAREGAWLELVPDERRSAIGALIAEADRIQMRDKRFRRELAAWIHPNKSAARRGVRGYGFGIGDLLSHAGPLVMRTFDLGKGQAAKDRELAAGSLLGVLGTRDDSPQAWLAAGQAMERVLLRACAHGLTASFLNQPVEVDALRSRLAKAIGRFNEYPQLVLRFGYGPDVPHSPREQVSQVLRHGEEAGLHGD